MSQIAGLGTLVGAAFPKGGGGLADVIKDIFKTVPGSTDNTDTTALSDLADFGG